MNERQKQKYERTRREAKQQLDEGELTEHQYYLIKSLMEIICELNEKEIQFGIEETEVVV